MHRHKEIETGTHITVEVEEATEVAVTGIEEEAAEAVATGTDIHSNKHHITKGNRMEGSHNEGTKDQDDCEGQDTGRIHTTGQRMESGTTDFDAWSRSRVHRESSGTSQTQQIDPYGRNDFRRYISNVTERMDTKSEELADRSRPLFKIKTSEESFRKVEVYSSMCRSEQVHEEEALQMRRSQDFKIDNTTRSLHGTVGHRGRFLFETTETAQGQQEVFQVRNTFTEWCESLRVSSDPAGMELKSTHVDAYHETSGERSKDERYITRTSNGRHNNFTHFRDSMQQATGGIRKDSNQASLQVQAGKEKTSFAETDVVRSGDNDKTTHKDGTYERKEAQDEETSWMDSTMQRARKMHPEDNSRLHRGDSQRNDVFNRSYEPHSEFSDSAERSFTGKSQAMGRTVPTFGSSGQRIDIFQNSTGIRSKAPREQFDRDQDGYGCFKLRIRRQDTRNTRMAAERRTMDQLRILERTGAKDAHQRKRALREHQNDEGMFTASDKDDNTGDDEKRYPSIACKSNNRQQGSAELPQQAGRTLKKSKHAGIEEAGMGEKSFLPSADSLHVNVLRGRQNDRDWWRRAQQDGTLGRRDNVEQENIQRTVQEAKLQTEDRSNGNSVQFPTPTIPRTISRQVSREDEHVYDDMDRRQLHFSNPGDDTKSSAEDRNRQGDGLSGATIDSKREMVADNVRTGSKQSIADNEKPEQVFTSKFVHSDTKTVVQMDVDWHSFIVQQLRQSKGLENADAEKMAKALWAPNTIPRYKSEWKRFHSWHQDVHGKKSLTKSDFIRSVKTYLSTLATDAMEKMDMYYEQLNNKMSVVSGTIKNSMNVDVSMDIAIQRLRERAKTVLKHRRDTKAREECTDVQELLQAIDALGKNRDLPIKTLRAKMTVLMILDTAARPSTLHSCMMDEEQRSTNQYGEHVKFNPTMTKDQQLSKDKSGRKLNIQGFPHRQNLCTVTAFKEYMRRIKSLDVVKDQCYAAIDENGKPYKKEGTSIFITLTKPHGSMSASTVRSEAKKFLDSLGSATSSRKLRHSIPSLIQLIDGLSDAETANTFRWNRTDTYKQWYKSEIPKSIQDKFRMEKVEFPTAWKIRHNFIDKSRIHHLVKPTKSTSKDKNNITSYFTSE